MPILDSAVGALSSSPVGFLVPLNGNLEEDVESRFPKIPIFHGITSVGRDSIPVDDKRLSRRHLTIKVLRDGSSEIVVEGTNPVVVRPNNERKKLFPGEALTIRAGDVVELIPGQYLYKYAPVINSNFRSTKMEKKVLNEESREDEYIAPVRKRIRKVSEEEAVLVKSEDVSTSATSSSKDIRHFQVSKDDLALTFRLLRVKDLPAWANTNAVSLNDVIQGDIIFAVLSNYMVDIDWLLSECPKLKRVPHVLIVHGEGDGTLEYMKKNKPSHWILHKPPLPISYGTHHSKAMLLVYPRGLRVVVHTANLIYVDWNNKTQGLWMQDFPWKDQNITHTGNEFENDLIDYLGTLKLPEFNINLPNIGSLSMNPKFFKKFDYRAAMVRLIASVPGYHSGSSLRKWGHMKLQTILQECTFDNQFEKSPLIYQFSSLGSLDEKWMNELASSLSAGTSEDGKPLGIGKPSIIWPTVEDVKYSLEGYAAGNAIPSPLKNVEKEFLKKYWAKWSASHTGRSRAMPHIKTFARYNGQNLAWLLLTSSNLSKAAWGALQKNSSQLMIRSYELGVLFLPVPKRPGCNFSCTDEGRALHLEDKSTTAAQKKLGIVTLLWKANQNEQQCRDIIELPVPYELPPKPYSSGDIPWSWDRRYMEKDVYGQVWPREVKLYSNQHL